MPDPTQIRRLDQRPLRQAISTRGRSLVPWLTKDDLIKYFFGANAWMSIVVLGLIMLSLYSESIGFNPAEGFFGQNYRNLLVYRQAGLEFVDISRRKRRARPARQISGRRPAGGAQTPHRAGQREGKPQDRHHRRRQRGARPRSTTTPTSWPPRRDPLNDIISTLGDTVTATKDAVIDVEDKKAEKQLYLRSGKTELADQVTYQEVDLDAAVKPLRDALPSMHDANDKFPPRWPFATQPPPAASEAMKAQLGPFPQPRARSEATLPGLPEAGSRLEPHQPLPWYAGIVDFFFNTKWLTASSWQDYYGIVPLLVGSTLISIVALVIAVPLGVGAGVYINQIATPWEQHIVKPAIEFISAIPSVVLGFFGVAVLGRILFFRRHANSCLSRVLGWSILPPFSERLNILTAGILLAFMAVPTIFTLTEDAMNNVPRSFKEASYALGANRLQTIWRIILPASLSGVISAVLLGFGRVIGETMVVLLCAGNRIAIPPLSDGLMVVFQPVHTMTGIIAQELGEAEQDGIQWHALFMVGCSSSLFRWRSTSSPSASSSVSKFPSDPNLTLMTARTHPFTQDRRLVPTRKRASSGSCGPSPTSSSASASLIFAIIIYKGAPAVFGSFRVDGTVPSSITISSSPSRRRSTSSSTRARLKQMSAEQFYAFTGARCHRRYRPATPDGTTSCHPPANRHARTRQ